MKSEHVNDAVQTVVVLGATGSIGDSTLDIVRQHPDRYQVLALTAAKSVDKLCELCLEFKPRYAVLLDESAGDQLRNQLQVSQSDTEVLCGEPALCQVAKLEEADMVMAAIVGAAGLAPTMAAVQAGKKVLLANKEALVMSGELFMQQAQEYGAHILPVDSEHNAIFQCLPDDYLSRGMSDCGVTQLLLTASGGPFRTASKEMLEQVTPEQAVAHPNWEMGKKISVDSATMMNKGLELIEACWLFGVSAEQIDVLVHPQSIVHSLVRYADGSVLAQLGSPDMRTPIASAMAWPYRISSSVKPLDLVELARLDFEAPDMERFPCLQLAYDAMQAGGTAPAILNAANEEAVDAFLHRKLEFNNIAMVITETLGKIDVGMANSLDNIMQADAEARVVAKEVIANSL